MFGRWECSSFSTQRTGSFFSFLRKEKPADPALMAVKDKVLVSVGDIESAWERWETPQRMYESVTIVNMKFLRQRFFPSKMQEGTSLSQHLDKMEKMIKELVAVRVKMTDRDQWPGSLLKSFESLPTTLSRETPPLTIDWSDHFL